MLNFGDFQGLEHDKDPIAGDHDGTCNMTIQHKPINKTLHALPRFTTRQTRGLRLAARAAGAPLARQRLTGAHHAHEALPQSLVPRRSRSCGSGSHEDGRVHRLVPCSSRPRVPACRARVTRR
jgi:hypothetical protein